MREIYKWGLGAVLSYFGLIFSWASGAVDTLDWLSIVERMGIPTAFLVVFLWMLSKAAKAVWPFLKGQIEELVEVPKEQLKAERKERLQQQQRYEEVFLGTIREQSDSNGKVVEALTGLKEAIETMVADKEVKRDE